jgi:hypothetical protein
MAIINKVEELPDYSTAYAEHLVAIRDAGTDKLAESEAKLRWSERLREFDTKLVAHNTVERAFEAAKEKIAADFPDVPAQIYASAVTPEQMLEQAKLFDDAVKAKTAAPATAPVGGGGGGQPPTGVGSAPDPNEGKPAWMTTAEATAAKMRNGEAKRPEVETFMNTIAGLGAPLVRDAKQAAQRGQ